ncbi:MAG: hypothetical protein R3E08_04125 [Thiotrichaceae bacterium]
MFTDQDDAKILTSTELAQLSDAEVKQLLPKLFVVVSRPASESFSQMCWRVRLGGRHDGDGVNDAPA